MSLVEFFCHNRDTTVYINPDKILFLKRMQLAGSTEKEICEIVIEKPSDDKGSILVFDSIKSVATKIKNSTFKASAKL